MADINDLAQKIAFYQAGGKDPGTSGGERFMAGFDMVNHAVKSVLDIKKAQYENQKTQAETQKLTEESTPFRDIALPLTPSNATINENTTPEQRKSIDMLYGVREAMGNKTLRQAKTESDIIPKDRKGGIHRIINKITGQVISEYPSSPGTGDTFTAVGEETLPTYTKSEILGMSPEVRATLGKYKIVDDTAPNKNEDENQTVESILSGIDRLGQIRSSMNGLERGATVVPGGTAVGRMVSGDLSSWETEKNLLAQRLGKLVERNRMSDDDRKFYLRQFSSPAATDAAFTANSEALRNALSGMKKVVPGGQNKNNDPLGIR